MSVEQAKEEAQPVVEVHAKQEHVNLPTNDSPVKPEQTVPAVVVAAASPVKVVHQEAVSPSKISPSKTVSESVTSPVKVSPSKTRFESIAPTVTSPVTVSPSLPTREKPEQLTAKKPTPEKLGHVTETTPFVSPVKAAPTEDLQKKPEDEPAGIADLDTEQAEVEMETEEHKQEDASAAGDLQSAEVKGDGSDDGQEKECK